LISLGSRIRVRRLLEPLDREAMLDYLNYALDQAGAAHLVSAPLKETLVDHAAGNLRVLNNMALELLSLAARDERPQLDEQLFLQAFSQGRPSPEKQAGRKIKALAG
jgi:general secretion pathway protein A